MRALIVAGTGFIGGHTARAFLGQGVDVTVLVRDARRAHADPRLLGARVVEGRVGAPPAIPSQDVVVYAAGAWRPDDRAPPREIDRRCREVYVEGVERLSASAREWGAHFVFMSGTSRYGIAASPVLTEETPPGVLSTFGAYKRQAEAILASTPGLRWTAVVPPEVYGAHDPGGYVHFVYKRVRSRRFILLGRGDNLWSLCNVQNVADAIVAIAGGEGHGILHVADARPTSQRELATAIARALGRAPVFPRVPRSMALAAATFNTIVPLPGPRLTPGHVRSRTRDIIVDISRMRRAGILPRASLAEGIADAIAWWGRRADRAR